MGIIGMILMEHTYMYIWTIWRFEHLKSIYIPLISNQHCHIWLYFHLFVKMICVSYWSNIIDHGIEYDFRTNVHISCMNTLISLEGLKLKWTFTSKSCWNVQNIQKKNWYVCACWMWNTRTYYIFSLMFSSVNFFYRWQIISINAWKRKDQKPIFTLHIVGDQDSFIHV